MAIEYSTHEDMAGELKRLVTALHADSCTSEVGTAYVNLPAIKNHHLEMYTWT